jgi:ABC-type lipoprotein release transport system permease subunit
MRKALIQVSFGLAIGIPIAPTAAHLIENQLLNASSYDPLSLFLAIVALVFSAAIAGAIPAQWAASVEPVTTLRVE